MSMETLNVDIKFFVKEYADYFLDYKFAHYIIPILLEHQELWKYCLVALADGKPLGIIVGEPTHLSGTQLVILEVDYNYRKLGIGSVLLKNFQKLCKGNTIQVYFNKDLKNFYEKNGFVLNDTISVGEKVVEL